MRLSTGSLGGKARGLAFANNLLKEASLNNKFVWPCILQSTPVVEQYRLDSALPVERRRARAEQATFASGLEPAQGVAMLRQVADRRQMLNL